MNPYNFSVLFFAFCSFFIGLFVWLKRQDSVGKLYFFFSLLAAIWGVGYSVMVSGNTTYQIALISSRIINGSVGLLVAVWIHLTLVISNEYSKQKKLLLLSYAIAGFIALSAFTEWLVPYLKPALSFKYYTRGGPVFYLYTLFYFSFVPIGFAQLFSRLKRAGVKERLQIKGFSIATMAGFIGGSVTFLPCYDIMFPQYAIFLFPIYPFMMAYFMTREQLFDVEELAQAAHRGKLAAIGTLATSINHEIRNPLYVIQGLAGSFIANREEGIYKETTQTVEKAEEILRKVGDHAIRAMDIMKSFALFAKQNVSETSRLEPVDLNEVLSTVTPLVKHELDLERIELKQNIPTGLSPLKVDRRHLEEIFFNLIVNACQAIKSTDAPGKISISASQQNGSVNIEVSDNGPGIPQNRLKQVFEPFYTTKDEGTGLGLYITKQLIEKNSGKIRVNSKAGTGTSFSLEFKR